MSDTPAYLAEHLPAWHRHGAIPADDWRELSARLAFGATTLREVADSIAVLAETGDVGLVGTYALNEICHRLLIVTGADDLRGRVRDGSLRLALGITEQQAGSDLASLRTTVDPATGTLVGEKMYISNSAVADRHIVAARTGEGGGFPILSLFLVPSGLLAREDLHGTGARLMPLARVRIDRVPIARTRPLGRAGRGFRHLNQTLEFERAVICVIAVRIGGYVVRALADRLRRHEVFGAPLAEHAYHRLNFAAWSARGRTLALACDALVERFDRGGADPHDVLALKVEASRYCRELVSAAQHVWGAAGWVRGGPLATLHDDTRWLSLGGGADELLLTRIARHDLDEP